MIDIGVNLGSTQFDADRAQVVRRARVAGVHTQILISSDLSESLAMIRMAQEFDLYCTAGVHPHQALSWNESSADVLLGLLNAPRVCAVGECGLDFNRLFSPRAEQLIAFEAQLQIAAETGKPVYLHCRDAHEDFIRLLRAHRHRISAAVLHCFTGTRVELQECLALDLHIGITGWICDERRGQLLRELVSEIPAHRLLLETDAPYLLPRDLQPKPSSRRNEPAYLPHIAASIAGLRGLTLQELCAQTSANAQALFALP